MKAEAPDAAAVAALDDADRAALIGVLAEEDAIAMLADWRFWARPSQLPPPGDWRIWLVMAGRGFGKTRAGAEWVRGIAEADPQARIALVGATTADVRRVMIEGESGLLGIAPAGWRPRWEPSLGRLRWPNGAEARLFSASEPEALRGPQHSHAWCDEIAKWANGQETWDNLMLGLRLGSLPRVMATTTPRPVPLLRGLIGRDDVVVTGGRTRDNRQHLPPGFIAAVTADYAGTRLGRQELDGELIEEIEGAIWPRALIERCRVREAPEMARVVLGVDPPAGAGAGSDACGIVVAALGRDGIGYVIEDASVQGLAPEGWAAAVVSAARRHGADRVIAEANNGGAMVESVLRAGDAGLPVRLVHASRGKAARAEPVSVLYERGQVRHIGAFPALEDELAGFALDGRYEGPGRSPDRADALVWALTALLLERRGQPAVRVV
ncbi:DNA-packaging protein [Sphingomonas oryzagri]|uniref:Terminase family protein n=1 Tax=Sphingomonas oryzagri TaxID=3042314 RepID=A0ABT6N2V4_9SPHN|nr:terminase family protein [Sphingomonas oryzagri]MDH7639590.1 terminase family protein [Sphingomonas oryzagri]